MKQNTWIPHFPSGAVPGLIWRHRRNSKVLESESQDYQRGTENGSKKSPRDIYRTISGYASQTYRWLQQSCPCMRVLVRMSFNFGLIPTGKPKSAWQTQAYPRSGAFASLKTISVRHSVIFISNAYWLSSTISRTMVCPTPLFASRNDPGDEITAVCVKNIALVHNTLLHFRMEWYEFCRTMTDTPTAGPFRPRRIKW